MKIAIASDDQQLINSHFGRTRGFVIIELESNREINREYRLNTFTHHAQGEHHDEHSNEHHSLGQHSHSSILTALSDCKAVISNGMGMRIYNDLKDAGIQPIITRETIVNNAVELFIKDDIDNNPETGCSHHGGH